MPKSTDLLAGHPCSVSPLFKGMYDCAHYNKDVAAANGKIVDYDAVKGNGSLSNVCSVIAPYMEKAGSSLYNSLTKGSHSDLLSNALTAGDIAYEANKGITPDELGTEIAKQLASELKENGIKSGKGHASTGSTPRPAAAKISVPTQVDFTSLITPPSPDTDPEYKALLNKVAEAQEKSNKLLASENKDFTEIGRAMCELQEAQNAVADYAKNHADTSGLEKKIDELENGILEDELAYEATYNRINSLCEKARTILLSRNAKREMLEKAKAALPASENK
jgi:hypothetical protein